MHEKGVFKLKARPVLNTVKRKMKREANKQTMSLADSRIGFTGKS
jgi:hypothetical protein